MLRSINDLINQSVLEASIAFLVHGASKTHGAAWQTTYLCALQLCGVHCGVQDQNMDAADVDADDVDMDELADAELAGADGADALGPRAQVGLV